MMYKILTTGGRLLLTRDKGKALKALAEGGKKASQKFIEKIKSPKKYYRKLKERFKRRKSKEGDPDYAKKAKERKRVGYRRFNYQMENMLKPAKEAGIRDFSRISPRVAGRINPKGKTSRGMPSQKKFKGGLIRKPKLALRGF